MTLELSTFDKFPFLAILRGISPAEVDAVSDALIGGGIRAIEIPLNSPQPFYPSRFWLKNLDTLFLLSQELFWNQRRYSTLRMLEGG